MLQARLGGTRGFGPGGQGQRTGRIFLQIFAHLDFMEQYRAVQDPNAVLYLGLHGCCFFSSIFIDLLPTSFVQFCDLRPFSYCPGGALSDMLLLRHSQNTTFGGLPLYTCSIPKTGMGSNCIHDELSFGHIWAVTICPKSTPRSFVSSSSPQSATF